MTERSADTSDDALEIKRKSSCRMNFKRFRKRRKKMKDLYNYASSDINVKTALIENEIIADDTNDEWTDQEIISTCKRLKFCKQSDKTDIYIAYGKNMENSYLERDETMCPLADLEDIMQNQTTSNSLFTKKKKKFYTYRSCFSRNRNRNKNKKISWFRLRRNKKKEHENDNDIKYLKDASASNSQECTYMKSLENNVSQYNTTYVINAMNNFKRVTPWLL